MAQWKQAMTQEQVNRIITEKVLGECWHEYQQATANGELWVCSKCGRSTGYSGRLTDFPDYSQWVHYGPLLEKIQSERYWEVISYYTHRGSGYGEGDYEKFNEDLLNPTRGSLAIAEFVKDREGK